MPGVRLLHPTARSVRFTVVEKVPYKEPYQCPAPEFGGCGTTHLFKTHHLNVDGQGATIIEAKLFERLKLNLELNGFQVANEVPKPPTIVVGVGPRYEGAGAWGNIPIVRGKS